MLVDDHASFRASARWLLETEGYVVVAEAGERARRALEIGRRACSPSSSCSTSACPGIDGFQVALAIRARCPRARVVLTLEPRSLPTSARSACSPAARAASCTRPSSRARRIAADRSRRSSLGSRSRLGRLTPATRTRRQPWPPPRPARSRISSTASTSSRSPAATRTSSTRPPARPTRRRPSRASRTSTAPTRPRPSAFEEWRDSTPAERQLALLRFADAIEARADEFVDAEVENTGKPRALTASEEIPPMVDQIRFFAGAARVLEGRSAGEYMRGMTSFIRREPIGVVGQVTPWNYPLLMATWKIGPALAAGNCDRPQAERHDAGLDAADGRGRRGVLPARRLQRDLRRSRHRPRARVAPDAAARRHHGLGAGGHGGRVAPPPPTSSACTSSSAARRR